MAAYSAFVLLSRANQLTHPYVFLVKKERPGGPVADAARLETLRHQLEEKYGVAFRAMDIEVIELGEVEARVKKLTRTKKGR